MRLGIALVLLLIFIIVYESTRVAEVVKERGPFAEEFEDTGLDIEYIVDDFGVCHSLTSFRNTGKIVSTAPVDCRWPGLADTTVLGKKNAAQSN